MSKPFDLQRFIDAQAPVWDAVKAELTAGRKQTHWMWFVFPQIAGLGHSPMAQRYAIATLAEARAYLAHPILGARLREAVMIVDGLRGSTAHDIFGSPDDLKFRSSLTLFAQASPEEPLFASALTRYYEGQPDGATLDLVATRP